MEALKIGVNWMVGWSNVPGLQILLDQVPDHASLRYQHINNLWFAEQGGYISFFSYDRPGDGYAGRHFPITTVDGEETVLKGPWSSRSGVMNLVPEFPQSLEVSWTVDPLVFTRGYTFYGGAVSRDWLLPQLTRLRPALNLERVERFEGEIYYQISKDQIDLAADPELDRGLENPFKRPMHE